MPITTVTCKILDKEWARRMSGGQIKLEICKARRLAQQGKVKILDKNVEGKKKTMTTYNTKVLMASENNYLSKTKFDNPKKKVRIGWVQDFSKVGGAELSNKHLVKIGKNLGFDIAAVTPVNFNKRILYDADLLIINNFFEFPNDKFNIVMDAIYEKRIPYIKYDHDHREMHRPYISRQMFTISKLNVFISPLHLQKTMELLWNQIKSHSICLPLSIDTLSYSKVKGIKRQKNSVIVPCYRKCKSNIFDFIKENKEKQYLIIGDIDFKTNGYKVESSGLIPPEKMPETFSKYESMLHLPFSFWAGERIYFESLLCGCKPIVNDNVGHNSWRFKNIKTKLDKAPFTFWKEVDKCLRT